MAMSSGGSSRGGLNANINVTPLCDIMLVLLIIFMVITPLLQKGVALKLPEAVNPTDHPDNEETVTLAITKDQALYINKIPITQAELITKLNEKFSKSIEKAMFLKADENLDYGDVLRIMTMCRDGGAEEIGLITEVKVSSY